MPFASPEHRRVGLPLQAEDEEGMGKSRVLPVGYGADTWSVVPAECPWLDVISGQIEVEADGTLRGGESQHRPSIGQTYPIDLTRVSYLAPTCGSAACPPRQSTVLLDYCSNL